MESEEYQEKKKNGQSLIVDKEEQANMKLQPDDKLVYKDFIRMILPPDYEVDWDYLNKVIADEIEKPIVEFTPKTVILIKTVSSFPEE